MNRRIPLFLTAFALSLAAAPALADVQVHIGLGAPCAPVAVHPVRPVPAPVVYQPVVYRPVYAPPPAPAPVVVASYTYRHARWDARAADLHRDYQRLDAARDHFYATWHGNPHKRDRFEAWYAYRRAELDQRRAELGRWYRY